MKYQVGKNLFREFARMRESLIFQYKKGDINKKEYIRQSHDQLVQHQARPFKNVDNFEKAVFNYHYYNTMAKFAKMQAEEQKRTDKHPELFREYIERRDRYYRLKDQMTWKAVQLEYDQGVEAYFIKVRADFLKDSLFEVIFHHHPQIVFHSRGMWLRKRLEEEGFFIQRRKRSVIESYVNEKY